MCVLLLSFLSSCAFNVNTSSDNEIVRFQGTFPSPQNITYKTSDGQTFTSLAYPGYMYLYVKSNTQTKNIKDIILENNNELVAARPDIGLYLIKIKEGEEYAFSDLFAKKEWYIDSYPAYTIVPGSEMVFYDLFSGEPNPKNCFDDHGELVEAKAKQFGGKTKTFDIAAWNLQDNVDIAGHMYDTIKERATKDNKVIFSVSLQSGLSQNTLQDSDLKDDCASNICKNVRREQKIYLEAYLATLELAINNEPKSAENAILVIISGNAGVSLDEELSDLRNKYKHAFAKVKIVGSSDCLKNANVNKKDNYLKDNSVPNMIYSCGENINIYDENKKFLASCSGTSFAAPEVASVLDYLWSKQPKLNANQLLSVFDKTLADFNSKNILPQEDKKTTQAFLDAVLANSKIMYRNLSLYTLTVKRMDEYYEAFSVSPMGYVEFNNCMDICYTTYDYGTIVNAVLVESDDAIQFTGWSGDCTGTNECIVNMTSDKELVMNFAENIVYLTIKWEGDGSGTTSDIPVYGQMDCGGENYRCIIPVLLNTKINLEPIPDEYSEFEKWSGDCGKMKTCDLLMDSNKTIIITFNKKTVETTIQNGECSYLCTHNADCNTYSWNYCDNTGALCNNDGKCYCTIPNEPSWKKCPCDANELCIGIYCAKQEGGCPDS